MDTIDRKRIGITIATNDIHVMSQEYFGVIQEALDANYMVGYFDFCIDSSVDTVKAIKVDKKEKYVSYRVVLKVEVEPLRLSCKTNQELALTVYTKMYEQYREYINIH